MLWRTYDECKNYLELVGHKGAILDLHWSRDSRIIFSASSDTTLASWDAETGGRIRRYFGHEDVVNTFDVARRGPELMVSASDDGTIGVSSCEPASCDITNDCSRFGIRDKKARWTTLKQVSPSQQ